MMDDGDELLSKEREKATLNMIFNADFNKLNKVLKKIIGI